MEGWREGEGRAREREREAARARESETAERLGGGLTRRAWLGSWLDVGLWHFELHRMLQIIVNRRVARSNSTMVRSVNKLQVVQVARP